MISRSVRAATLVAAMLVVPGLRAAEVAGVKVDDQIKVGSSELVLNGAGLRTKVFVKVYVGALYVTQKATTPAALLDATTPRRMNMRLLRDVDSDTLFGCAARRPQGQQQRGRTGGAEGGGRPVRRDHEKDRQRQEWRHGQHRLHGRWRCRRLQRRESRPGRQRAVREGAAQGLAGGQSGGCLAQEGVAGRLIFTRRRWKWKRSG